MFSTALISDNGKPDWLYATDAGAELEHVRHAATHSDIGMTQRYSRGSQDKVAKVMKLRAASRGKHD